MKFLKYTILCIVIITIFLILHPILKRNADKSIENIGFIVNGENGGSEITSYIFDNSSVENLRQIHYFYPSVEINNGDKGLENKINNILKEALVYLKIQPWTTEDFRYTHRYMERKYIYDMTLKTDKIVSFMSDFYWFNENEKIYITKIKGGITIDVINGEELYLDSIININEEFFETIQEDGYTYASIGDSGGSGTIVSNPASIKKMKRFLTEEELKYIFNYKYTEEPSTIHNYCITENEIIIFFPNNLAEEIGADGIILSYEKIKEYLKYDV